MPVKSNQPSVIQKGFISGSEGEYSEIVAIGKGSSYSNFEDRDDRNVILKQLTPSELYGKRGSQTNQNLLELKIQTSPRDIFPANISGSMQSAPKDREDYSNEDLRVKEHQSKRKLETLKQMLEQEQERLMQI